MRIATSLLIPILMLTTPGIAANKRARPAQHAVTEAVVARDLIYGCAAFVPGAMDYLVGTVHWSPDGAKRNKIGWWIGHSARQYLQYKRSGETDYPPYHESPKNLAEWARDQGDTRFAQLLACVNGRVDAHLKGMPFLLRMPNL